ncbi:uncharacterized protein PAC_13096 [Phialocephala subalpina]|uniref:Uncharacterized protein n=1 Tax=Phialocephala subalpina TaxID=576137 RepID=A0A1L7XDT1_9HELO|nr:uncharacterized protein PAC_13096 [Phialocephala subalpina]
MTRFRSIELPRKKSMLYLASIRGVLHSHKYICAQIGGIQEAKRAGDTSRLSKIWPDLRYVKLHPLCGALITVFDEYNHVVAKKHADSYRHFDDVAEEQSILLIWTGKEDELSSGGVAGSLERI